MNDQQVRRREILAQINDAVRIAQIIANRRFGEWPSEDQLVEAAESACFILDIAVPLDRHEILNELRRQYGYYALRYVEPGPHPPNRW